MTFQTLIFPNAWTRSLLTLSHLLKLHLCVDLQDPQYMQQALTNALLMDAVVGSLQSSKAIYAASKLAHFDRIKTEGRTD